MTRDCVITKKESPSMNIWFYNTNSSKSVPELIQMVDLSIEETY